jgi:hypothetical protein
MQTQHIVTRNGGEALFAAADVAIGSERQEYGQGRSEALRLALL